MWVKENNRAGKTLISLLYCNAALKTKEHFKTFISYHGINKSQMIYIIMSRYIIIVLNYGKCNWVIP